MVSPAIVTSGAGVNWLSVAGWMTKTELFPEPEMASFLAPGPSMSRLLAIVSGPLVSEIVPPSSDALKLMVSPGWAMPIAWRRVPAPLRPETSP